MNEEELKILEQCMDILEYVNMHLHTQYSLEQLGATAQKFSINEAGTPIFYGTLRECDNALIGMCILAKSLIKE